MSIKSERLRRFAFAGAVTGFLAFGAACSDDDNDIVEPPPPPPAEGTVTALVTDDPGVPGENGQPTATYSGTLTAQAQVQLSPNGETWTDLGAQENIQVNLQSPDRATLHEQANVAADDYTHVRLIMSNVEVQLDAGGTVGETPIEDDLVLLVAEGEQLLIESQLPTPLQVAEGVPVTVVFDLNSEAWLTEEAVQAEQVAAGDMEGAVDVDVDGDEDGDDG